MKDFKLFTDKVISLFSDVENDILMDHYRSWKKVYLPEEDISLSMDNYIKAHLPSSEQLEVRSYFPGQAFILLKKALSSAKIPLINTVAGLYVDAAGKEALEKFLALKPLYSLWAEQCHENKIDTTVPDYYSFLHSLERNTIKRIKNHPMTPVHREYYSAADESNIRLAFKQWMHLYLSKLPSPISGFCNLDNAATLLNISPAKLLMWCEMQDSSDIVTQMGQVLISKKQIDKIAERKKALASLPQLLADFLTDIPPIRRSAVKDAVMNNLSGKLSWLANIKDLPDVKANAYYYADRQDDALSFISLVASEVPTIPLRDLTKPTGLTNQDIVALCKENIVCATCVEGKYFISEKEFKRINEIANKYITLDSLVADEVGHANIIFNVDIQRDREYILGFLKQSSLYEEDLWITPEDQRLPISFGKLGVLIPSENASDVSNVVLLGLRLRDKTSYEQCEVYFSLMKDKFPSTVWALRGYIVAHKNNYEKPTLDMIAQVYEAVTSAGKELDLFDEEEIDDHFAEFFCNGTIKAAKITADFLYEKEYTSRLYVIKDTGVKKDKSAYSPHAFSIIADYVINLGTWEKHNLLQKAIEDSECADAWLNVAMHLCAAWRYSDFKRLPMPILPERYDPNSVLTNIFAHKFSAADARYISKTYSNLVKSQHFKPHKTTNGESLPGYDELYFDIPPIIEVQVGTIIAIVWAHCQLTYRNEFFVPRSNKLDMLKFFGREFVRACGDKGFNGRRAAKTLIQATAETDAKTHSDPRFSYMLASYMRSHKQDYDTLSNTTGLYLRDSDFDLLSPSYVFEQMQLRGSMSFVADALFKDVYGDKYINLPVAYKTNLIETLSLSPYQLTGIRKIVEDAENRAVELIREVQKMPNAVSPTQMLENIYQDKAYGKGREFCCVCRAAGLSCQVPDRLNCLGCHYEMRTKALFILYLDNYVRLCRIIKTSSSDKEIAQATCIITDTILPALREILALIELTSAGDEIEAFRKIYEERIGVLNE